MKKAFKATTALALAMVFLLAACSGESPAATGGTPPSGAPANQSQAPGQPEAKAWKVALCTSGPINDNDWNAMAYEGLELMKSSRGVETAYVESVAQSDQEEVMRSFIDEGYNVVYAHGYEFGDAMEKLAGEFPEVKFVITSAGLANGTNLASCNIHSIEQGFLVGAAAALASEVGHVALIGSMEIPPIQECLDGFELGAKYINPDCKVDTDFLGSFDDAAKLKELMTSYINSGVDVGACNADQAARGGIEALADAGKKCIGLNFDQGVIAPGAVVTNIGQSYAKAMDDVLGHIIDGTFEGTFYTEGVATGTIFLIPNPEYEVPKEIEDGLNAVIEAIEKGEIPELLAQG